LPSSYIGMNSFQTRDLSFRGRDCMDSALACGRFGDGKCTNTFGTEGDSEFLH
jgi:hypothetical protein